MSSMNRASGGAGTRPMYSIVSVWPTGVQFATEVTVDLGAGRISRSCYAGPFGLNGELQRELGLITTWRRSWPREASWKPWVASQFLIHAPSGCVPGTTL